ncbi:MAG: diacylglycerol kinase family protein [Pyrinomonadaceae bacterium]
MVEQEQLIELHDRTDPAVTGVCIVANAGSGTGTAESVREQLIELFAGHGVTARFEMARDGGEITNVAKTAAAASEQIVVACGGDGTMNAVANALAGTDNVMGVIALGTFNHFAKDLGIPLDLAGAVEVICTGAVHEVDAAEVNGHIFVNNSSLGLYPQLVHRRQKQQRLGHGKWPAFFWAAVTVLRRFAFMRVHLIADQKEFGSRTPLIFIGNNRYEMEGLNIGGRKSLRDGVLSVYLTKRTGRWGLLVLALKALFGRLRGAKDFVSLTTTELTIETRRRLINVAVDGETMAMSSPLHYQIRPGVLRVLVPSIATEAEK